MTFDTYLREKNISPSEAARALGISLSMISKLKNRSHSRPSLALAQEIYVWSNKQVNLLENAE